MRNPGGQSVSGAIKVALTLLRNGVNEIKSEIKSGKSISRVSSFGLSPFSLFSRCHALDRREGRSGPWDKYPDQAKSSHLEAGSWADQHDPR